VYSLVVPENVRPSEAGRNDDPLVVFVRLSRLSTEFNKEAALPVTGRVLTPPKIRGLR